MHQLAIGSMFTFLFPPISKFKCASLIAVLPPASLSCLGFKMHHQRLYKITGDHYKDIEAVDRKTDSWESASLHTLQRCKSTARDIAECQAKVEELEAHFRKLEETYLQTKAVQDSKHEQFVSNRESLSSAKSQNEDIKRMTQVLSKRRREREEIISEQMTALTTLEETTKTDLRFMKGQQEAVAWYNRALGFRIECGHGIKFIFINIDQSSPAREFSFTIRHCRRNDSYTLLDCDPSFEGSRELLDELNQTNDLFEFVRAMRKKFQELAPKGHEMSAKVGDHYLVPDEISDQSHAHLLPEMK